jgi:hypothetical protein
MNRSCVRGRIAGVGGVVGPDAGGRAFRDAGASDQSSGRDRFEAKEALRQGVQHPDREIRYRCLRILALVEENDFQRRLAAFATGQDDEHGLPGWQRYREQFGDQAESRAMFVEMQKPSPTSCSRSRPDAGGQQDLEVRCLEIQQTQPFTRQPVSLGSIAPCCSPFPTSRFVFRRRRGLFATLCYQPEIQNAMHDAGRRPIVRRLLGDWINRNDLGRRFKTWRWPCVTR